MRPREDFIAWNNSEEFSVCDRGLACFGVCGFGFHASSRLAFILIKRALQVPISSNWLTANLWTDPTFRYAPILRLLPARNDIPYIKLQYRSFRTTKTYIRRLKRVTLPLARRAGLRNCTYKRTNLCSHTSLHYTCWLLGSHVPVLRTWIREGMDTYKYAYAYIPRLMSVSRRRWKVDKFTLWDN